MSTNPEPTPRTLSARAYDASTSTHRIMAGTVVFPTHGRTTISLDAVDRGGRRHGSTTVRKPHDSTRARVSPIVVPKDGFYRWEATELGVVSAWVHVGRK